MTAMGDLALRKPVVRIKGPVGDESVDIGARDAPFLPTWDLMRLRKKATSEPNPHGLRMDV